MPITHKYLTESELKTDSNYTRGKAIRAKCLDCCCGQANEVRLCTAEDCQLFPFRLGSLKAANKVQNERLAPIFSDSSLIQGGKYDGK